MVFVSLRISGNSAIVCLIWPRSLGSPRMSLLAASALLQQLHRLAGLVDHVVDLVFIVGQQTIDAAPARCACPGPPCPSYRASLTPCSCRPAIEEVNSGPISPLDDRAVFDRLAIVRRSAEMDKLQRAVAQEQRAHHPALLVAVDVAVLVDLGGHDHPFVVVGELHVPHLADADAGLADGRVGGHARRLAELDVDRVLAFEQRRRADERDDENRRDQKRRQDHHPDAELHDAFIHDSFLNVSRYTPCADSSAAHGVCRMLQSPFCISLSRSPASPRMNWVTRRSRLRSRSAGRPS